MGTMGCGDNGDHNHGGVGTTWKPSGDNRDDVGMMGTMLGPWGQ